MYFTDISDSCCHLPLPVHESRLIVCEKVTSDFGVGVFFDEYFRFLLSIAYVLIMAYSMWESYQWLKGVRWRAFQFLVWFWKPVFSVNKYTYIHTYAGTFTNHGRGMNFIYDLGLDGGFVLTHIILHYLQYGSHGLAFIWQKKWWQTKLQIYSRVKYSWYF